MRFNTRLFREVYGMLRAEIPAGTMTDAELMRASFDLLRLLAPSRGDAAYEAPGTGTVAGDAFEAQWPVDTVMRRHPWRLATHLRHAGHCTFEDLDRRHATASAEARRLMEYTS